MSLFQTTPPASRPAIEIEVEDFLATTESMLARRVEDHKTLYHRFWDSPHTPDALLAEMGANALPMLLAARENLESIERLAILGGEVLTDYIPASSCEPRRDFLVAENGTVTLSPPAEGFDAWGDPVEQ